MRSRLCVRQFKAEELLDDLFAGTPDTFLIKYLLAKPASCKDFGILVTDISVAFKHARSFFLSFSLFLSLSFLSLFLSFLSLFFSLSLSLSFFLSLCLSFSLAFSLALSLCAFRNQEFKILETQGGSEWNEEGFKALARVLI